MNIIVTGANGFLGAHLVDALKQEHAVTCLVRGKREIPGTTVISFTGIDDPAIETAFTGADVVIHAAAQLHGPWEEMERANVLYTRRLVELSKKHGLRQFVYISSENVSQGNTDIYSRTKQLGEEEVRLLPGHLIIRPTIIYGSGDTKYIGRMVKIIRKLPLVPVLGNGRALFQFVHVNDLIAVIRKGISDHIGGVYTIAGPDSMSYDAFLRNLMTAMHVNKKLVHLPTWLLKPAAHVLNLLFKQPPLTPTQLDNLKKDRHYDISQNLQTFGYRPTPLPEGLSMLFNQ